MSLAERVDGDLIDAVKDRDSTRTATLRLLKAAAKNAEVAKRSPLTDDEFEQVVTRQVKQRREAAEAYRRAGRPERAEQEMAELAVLQSYLPQQLDETSIRQIVQQAVAETGASGPSDLGRVMARVMPALRGRADGAQVQRMVREMLAQPPISASGSAAD